MTKIGTRDEYDKMTLPDKETGDNKKVFWKDDCPFCDVPWKEQNILWKWKYWYFLHNMFPYSGDQDHIMAIPYDHKRYFSELTDDEISELKQVHNFADNFYWDKNYFSCARETFANRSVEHYHIHFIPGKLQGKYLRKMLENQGFPIKEDELEVKVCN